MLGNENNCTNELKRSKLEQVHWIYFLLGVQRKILILFLLYTITNLICTLQVMKRKMVSEKWNDYPRISEGKWNKLNSVQLHINLPISLPTCSQVM